MAERRMFAKSIVDSDEFLDLPQTSQLLYFYLSMQADDDGFINNPKRIQRMAGCSEDDLKTLIAEKFLLAFESGIVLVRHWKIHNRIRSDRYRPSNRPEKDLVKLDGHMTYQFSDKNDGIPSGIPNGIPNDNQAVYQTDTQVSSGKISSGEGSSGEVSSGKVSSGKVSSGEGSLGKISSGEARVGEKPKAPAPPPSNTNSTILSYGEYSHVKLTNRQYSQLVGTYGANVVSDYIRRCDEYIQKTGKTYKDCFLTIKSWIDEDRPNGANFANFANRQNSAQASDGKTAEKAQNGLPFLRSKTNQEIEFEEFGDDPCKTIL